MNYDLDELVAAIHDCAAKMLAADDSDSRDLWYTTLRAHALALREDWDAHGRFVPLPEGACDG